MSTTLIRANGSNVTPANDAKLYQRKFNDCLFEDVTITTLGADQLSVPALYGMIQGRDFNIDAQTFTATLAESDTVTGYILVQIDLTTDELISLTAELDPYTPTYDDLNASGSVAEMIIATYEADTTQVTSITMTADVYEQDVHNLANGSDEWDDATQYAADDYVVHNGTLYQANTTPTLGTWDSTEWDRVDLTTLNDGLTQSTIITSTDSSTTVTYDFSNKASITFALVDSNSAVVQTKTVPTCLFSSGMTIPLGSSLTVKTSSSDLFTDGTEALKFGAATGTISRGTLGCGDSGILYRTNTSPGNGLGNLYPCNLYADNTAATSTLVTYNGSNSFTLTTSDGTLYMIA